MRTNHTNAPTRFVGFDSGGEVFLSQDRILRGIYPGKGDLYRRVLHTCETHDLFRFGIVATREVNPNPNPDLPYELVLEHERIPFVSYPHEWSASMLKDAAIFHLALFTSLGQHGLTIKDWHPYNILFKGTEPVFVDFTSIMPIENLQDEAYLTSPKIPPPFQHLWDTTSAHFFEMYRRMCVPYFLLPLYIMHNGQHARARTRMFETTMNAVNSVIHQDEAYGSRFLDRQCYKLRDIVKKLALIQRGAIKPLFLQLLRAEVQALTVSLQSSGYSDYYTAKGEDFKFEPSLDWNKKQRVVYDAIQLYKPRTLLDIGSNIGWFSILAAKLGCQVVAFDTDEACVDLLYYRAKQDSLSIVPLVLDITKPTPDVIPHVNEKELLLSLIGGDSPLLLSADKRLKCDMVLALGLVHHLALGKGLNFVQIVQMLSDFANRQLLVEFVALDDKLIQAEPTFFPAFSMHPSRFDWYAQNNFVKELGRCFRQIEIKNSYPDTRVIVVCTR